MSKTLKERINKYINHSNFELLPKLPVIITVNGRSFSKTTSLLEKPFSPKFAETICSTLLKLCYEIEGSIFGYCFSDEMIIVSKNDQNAETSPWYDNNIQKITSAVSSIATLHFNNYAKSIDLNLNSESIFITNVCTTPSITEAINFIIFKQQQAFQQATYLSCLYELLKKYNKNQIKEMLSNLNQDEKILLLQQECDINFNDYPSMFKRGIAAYKAPKIIQSPQGEIIKNKWDLNFEIPIFTQDHSFLQSVFHSGKDILRLK